MRIQQDTHRLTCWLQFHHVTALIVSKLAAGPLGTWKPSYIPARAARRTEQPSHRLTGWELHSLFANIYLSSGEPERFSFARQSADRSHPRDWSHG